MADFGVPPRAPKSMFWLPLADGVFIQPAALRRQFMSQESLAKTGYLAFARTLSCSVEG
jgi:hypothetical protein